MAKIREVMNPDLFVVGPAATVGEAVALMAQHKVGAALVMDADRLIGIFTERDTVRAIAKSSDAPGHQISAWMTRHPETVDPDADTRVALQTMLSFGFRHLPVVENGKVVGMVSMRDLAD